MTYLWLYIYREGMHLSHFSIQGHQVIAIFVFINLPYWTSWCQLWLVYLKSIYFIHIIWFGDLFLDFHLVQQHLGLSSAWLGKMCPPLIFGHVLPVVKTQGYARRTWCCLYWGTSLLGTYACTKNRYHHIGQGYPELGHLAYHDMCYGWLI